jgi:uncharacterized membrane protein
MKTTEFVHSLNEPEIVRAIAEAEQKTSGEIRLYVSHQKREDVLAAAEQRFVALEMANTRERNAVLLYFAPLANKFAIVGDTGVHEKAGQNFWEEIIQEMSPGLRAGHFTEAIVGAIHHVGEVLARHFPRSPDDQNELPDSIARG